MKYNLCFYRQYSYIQGTDGVICHAKTIVSYTFEFNANDLPVDNKGFTGEMVCGDYVFKRTYGVNSPSKT